MKSMPEGGTEYIPDLICDHTSRRAIQEEAFRKRLGQQVNLKSREKLFEFGFGMSNQTILLKQQKTRVEITCVDVHPKIRPRPKTIYPMEYKKLKG